MSDPQAPAPARSAAFAAFMRSPTWFAILGLDVLAIAASVAAYMRWHTVFAFAPMVVMAIVLYFVLFRLAAKAKAAEASGPADPLVE